MSENSGPGDDAAETAGQQSQSALLASEAFVGHMTDAFAAAVRQAVAEQAAKGVA